MRCVIAKMNLVLMNKAIAHYLEPSTQGTVFTFPSLYDDNEPYPLTELLLMVQEQIGLFESQFKEKPHDALAKFFERMAEEITPLGNGTGITAEKQGGIMGYGARTRLEFAQTYARTGNAAHALREVLGKERAERMTPHSLRARASELLNDYRTDELIEQFKAEMVAEGVVLPHYRGRIYRTDLMSEDKKDRLAKPDILNTETERNYPRDDE